MMDSVCMNGHQTITIIYDNNLSLMPRSLVMVFDLLQFLQKVMKHIVASQGRVGKWGPSDERDFKPLPPLWTFRKIFISSGGCYTVKTATPIFPCSISAFIERTRSVISTAILNGFGWTSEQQQPQFWIWNKEQAVLRHTKTAFLWVCPVSASSHDATWFPTVQPDTTVTL